MCGAPEQTQELPPGTDLSEHTVLTAIPALHRSGNGEALAIVDGPGLFSVDVAVS